MDERCRREVGELHEFFQGWFNGVLEDSGEAFGRMADVMGEGFELIGPDGRRRGREVLLGDVRGAHGMARGESPPMRIRIEELRGRPLADDLYLVTYEEWQARRGQERGRLSTAVFRRREGTPNGVEWLHVHEVWLEA